MAAINSIDELTPAARKKFNDFLWEARKRLKPLGLDVFLTETYRPQSRQDYLYAIGRTIPPLGKKYWRTKTRRSRHTKRRAGDIAFRGLTEKCHLYLEGDPREAQAWAIVAAVAKTFGLLWGGNAWAKFVDRPHLELP